MSALSRHLNLGNFPPPHSESHQSPTRTQLPRERLTPPEDSAMHQTVLGRVASTLQKTAYFYICFIGIDTTMSKNWWIWLKAMHVLLYQKEASRNVLMVHSINHKKIRGGHNEHERRAKKIKSTVRSQNILLLEESSIKELWRRQGGEI